MRPACANIGGAQAQRIGTCRQGHRLLPQCAKIGHAVLAKRNGVDRRVIHYARRSQAGRGGEYIARLARLQNAPFGHQHDLVTHLQRLPRVG